jgi:hypothetical protein
MEQLELAANEVPQTLVPVAIAKADGLVPVMVMPLMVSVAVPVFDSVATCAALVAPVTAVKVSDAGVREATGTDVTAAVTVTVFVPVAEV